MTIPPDAGGPQGREQQPGSTPQWPAAGEHPPTPPYPSGSDHPSGSQYPSAPQYPSGSEYPPGSEHPSAPGYPSGSQYPSAPGYPPGSQYPSAPGYPSGSQYPSAPQYPAPQYPAPQYPAAGPARWRGRRSIQVGAILLGVGLVLAIIGAVIAGARSLSKVNDFQRVPVAGGQGTVSFSKDGGYVAYYESSNVTGSTSQTVPLVTGVLINQATGERVPLETPYGNRSDGKIRFLHYDYNGHKGVALWQFHINTPGTYRVVLEPNSGAASDAVMAFGRSIAKGVVVGGIFVVVGVLLLVGGLITLIVGLVLRSRDKRRFREGGGLAAYGQPAAAGPGWSSAAGANWPPPSGQGSWPSSGQGAWPPPGGQPEQPLHPQWPPPAGEQQSPSQWPPSAGEQQSPSQWPPPAGEQQSPPPSGEQKLPPPEGESSR